jgi:hypothetical protein
MQQQQQQQHDLLLFTPRKPTKRRIELCGVVGKQAGGGRRPGRLEDDQLETTT